MSVINEFEAASIRISEENGTALVLNSEGARLIFPFTFLCKVTELCVMFDMENKKMMAVMPSGLRNSPEYMCKYLCIITKFWIEYDLPVPAARYWQDSGYLAARIGDQFREKLASYTLDRIINS